MSGACGRRMLAFYFWTISPFSSGSYPLLPHSSFPSYPFLECRKQGAAGRLRCRLGSGGAATTPGTILGPGGYHPRGRPGLPRAPARTPHYPNTPPTGPRDAGVTGMSDGVGDERVGRARRGPGEGEVWRRRDIPKMCSGWVSM